MARRPEHDAEAAERAARERADEKVAAGSGARAVQIAWGRAVERYFPAERYEGLYPILWGPVERKQLQRLLASVPGRIVVAVIDEALRRWSYLQQPKLSGVWGLAPAPGFANFTAKFTEIRGALAMRAVKPKSKPLRETLAMPEVVTTDDASREKIAAQLHQLTVKQMPQREQTPEELEARRAELREQGRKLKLTESS